MSGETNLGEDEKGRLHKDGGDKDGLDDRVQQEAKRVLEGARNRSWSDSQEG